MKKLFAVGALALLFSPVSIASAVPMCNGPDFSLDSEGHPRASEVDEAALGEQRLRAQGINANLTRFWNGCLQTFVREGGHETMRFYDPDTLREVSVN